MSRIPFSLPELHHGTTEVRGVLYLEDEFLVFEIETSLFGEFNKEQKLIKIEPKALQAIRFETGIFKDRICIRPKKADLLEALPGTFLREVALKVWRQHRRNAEQLVETIQWRILE